MKHSPLRARIYRNKGLRKKVFERDGGICAICKRFDAKWECDHILELWRGGKDEVDNCQTLCRHHHLAKTVGEAPALAKSNRLRVRHDLTTLRKGRRGPSDASVQADAASTRRDQGP